jgi:hypothetical protein
MPHETSRLAGIRESIAFGAIDDADVLHPLLRESALQSLAAAPLTLDHGMVGALQVGSLSRRDFSPQEVSLLSLLADRAALAVRHARRYEHERGIVETLQRSLLPPSLPLVPGFTMAARYLPAEADARVGGDWYDVVVLDDGGIAIAIGDVSGHGIRAAALMGQLRNALRAYAFEGYTPSVAAGRLDSLVRQLEASWFATLAYAVIEPDGHTLTLANAGHPAPLLVTPEGEARFLEAGRGSPLGTATSADAFEEAVHELPAGSLLLHRRSHRAARDAAARLARAATRGRHPGSGRARGALRARPCRAARRRRSPRRRCIHGGAADPADRPAPGAGAAR